MNHRIIDRLYDKCFDDLVQVAFKALRHHEDAEDVASEVFLALLTGRLRIRSKASLEAEVLRRCRQPDPFQRDEGHVAQVYTLRPRTRPTRKRAA